MGRYATRATLRHYCAQAGVTLYSHWLDGASYQYCAGGYVVNGYLGSRTTLSELKYEMQKELIFLLKYGTIDPIYYTDGSSIVWHKETHVISPLAEPLLHNEGFKVYTLLSREGDKEWQEYYNFLKS